MQVRALQRDFNIYSTGVLDLQEIHYKLYQKMKQPGLAYLASEILKEGLLLNSFANLADWRIRPLPIELVNYAALDSRTILRCWDEMKAKVGDQILSLNFEISKMYTEKVFNFPKSIEPINMWNKYIKSLRRDQRNVFKTRGQRALFFEISKLIVNKAKSVDSPVHRVMDVETVGLICRCMPKSSSQMFKILFARHASFGGLVSNGLRSEIVQIIDAHRDSMFSLENTQVIIDPPNDQGTRNERVRVFPITRAEAMQLEITQEELDNESDLSSDSDFELNYDAKAIRADLRDWNDPKRARKPSATGRVVSLEDNDPVIELENPQTSADRVPVRKLRVKRSGKILKIKRVFHFAARLGLSQEDLKVNLPKFPKRTLQTIGQRNSMNKDDDNEKEGNKNV